MRQMLRDTARLGASLSIYLDRLPWAIVVALAASLACFWALALIGATVVARAVLG